ncbi:MAG: hypothetical protein BMS9Abin32_080 [Gammaproteobacteria bacterium]|nr:MAG: hypothetical protein BMS9Abin32_080 [Gammaproteobacteria bacterium]
MLLTLCVSVAAAQSEAQDGEPVTQDGAATTRTDKAHRYFEQKVNATAQWFDSFFDDPNYLAEDASTRLRLRPEVFFQKKKNAKVRVKVAAKVNLPRLSKKLSLVIGGDDGTGDFDNSLDDTVDEPSIGLQFFGKQTQTWNISMTAGAKLNGVALFAGPRIRYLQPLGERSLLRFVQSFRWFTDNGWDTRTRIDFDHVFKGGLFLRQTFDGRRRADRYDEEGFRTRVSTSLTHRPKQDIGVQYEWFTIFNTKPDSRAVSTTFAVRFRKRTKREWLFYEIVPQLAIEEEFDWDLNPGIRLRFEIIFGEENRRRRELRNDNFYW